MESICLSLYTSLPTHTHSHTLLSAGPGGGGEKCCRSLSVHFKGLCRWKTDACGELRPTHERSDCWSLTSSETSSASDKHQINSDGCLTSTPGGGGGGVDGQVSVVPVFPSICFITCVCLHRGEVYVELRCE